MSQALPDQEPAGPLAVVLGLLAADAPRPVMGAPEDWAQWAALLPHVLAATATSGRFPDRRTSWAGTRLHGYWTAPRPTRR